MSTHLPRVAISERSGIPEVIRERDLMLEALLRSKLADIPRPLITPEQLAGVMRGEDVRPTPEQKREAKRVGWRK